MSDTQQLFGSDISRNTQGTIVLASGMTKTELRIIRRLLTPAGTYIWHPEYGAGLPEKVGTLLNARNIEGIIRQQLALESSVKQVPLPTVAVTPILNGVTVQIGYVDASTGRTSSLLFDVNP